MSRFSRSYRDARGRFLQSAAARGAVLEHHVHPSARGVNGEELAIDVALLGPPDAERIVLVTSGTHGVEGYCGSGVQNALLAETALLDRAAARGVRLMLLHALNPYGFSHFRRTNEDNVDLNRNFVDFDRPAAPDPDYEEVHALLFPPTYPWPESNREAVARYIAHRGQAHWQWAITHGQRVRPDGLFYAGDRPAWSNRVLRELLRRHVGGRRELLWVDVHTGLGPTGVGERIYAGRDNAADLARTRAVWGDRVTSVYDGSSTSARIDGIIGNAPYLACPQARLAAIALEFGTVPLDQVIDALRLEQWVRNCAAGDEALRALARQRLLDAFFVDTDGWRDAVIAQGLEATRRAIDAVDG